MSSDEEYIATFSWRSHSCSIVSKRSGVALCRFALPDDLYLDPTFMLNSVQFDPSENISCSLGIKLSTPALRVSFVSLERKIMKRIVS